MRSRLALGVAATDDTLRRVERAEEAVRRLLSGIDDSPDVVMAIGKGKHTELDATIKSSISSIDDHAASGRAAVATTANSTSNIHDNFFGVQHNLRIRVMSQGRAVVEVDDELLEMAALRHAAFEAALVGELGFKSVDIRPFRSGAVSMKIMKQ